nr:DUF3219 family protein [Oceanobacillus halotolerans]
MRQIVQLNDYELEVETVEVKEKGGKHLLTMTFPVTHHDYHDVTTLLYENDFHVKVPEEDISFSATIAAYSTSITNLYEKDAVGKFYLQLLEK